MRRGGDSLDLSEMYTVRQCYLDKADRFVRMYGQANFGPGGSVLDVPYVWRNYGVIPEKTIPASTTAKRNTRMASSTPCSQPTSKPWCRAPTKNLNGMETRI